MGRPACLLESVNDVKDLPCHLVSADAAPTRPVAGPVVESEGFGDGFGAGKREVMKEAKGKVKDELREGGEECVSGS